MADAFLNELAWQRSSQPVLSTMTTEQTWCRVTLYNPTVIKVDGRYEMWYLGNSSATRNNDMDLGYAESEDGLHWTAFSDNPILRTGETPVGQAWQTPHVLFDADEGLYKMWFVMSQRLGTTSKGPLMRQECLVMLPARMVGAGESTPSRSIRAVAAPVCSRMARAAIACG